MSVRLMSEGLDSLFFIMSRICSVKDWGRILPRIPPLLSRSLTIAPNRAVVILPSDGSTEITMAIRALSTTVGDTV